MTAAEARKRAEEIKQAEINGQMTDVMEEIELAVRQGHMVTDYYKPLTQEIIDILEKEPNFFKIVKQSRTIKGDYYEVNNNYYEISW